MELEAYETILIILAIVATGALVVWALSRGTQDGPPAVDHPDKPVDEPASNLPPEPSADEETLVGAAGATRARDAARSRSGSARRTVRQGASSGRAASAATGVPSGGSAPPPEDHAAEPVQAPAASEMGKELPEQDTPAAPEIIAKPPESDPAQVEPNEIGVPDSTENWKDDLTVIRGIGKSIEKKLNAMGVTTFEQMASWTREDLDRVDAALAFPGRAQRENWVGQAKTLAEKK